jgi:hypothetical protein
MALYKLHELHSKRWQTGYKLWILRYLEATVAYFKGGKQQLASQKWL